MFSRYVTKMLQKTSDFQQDGAPPHFAFMCMSYLTQNFLVDGLDIVRP